MLIFDEESRIVVIDSIYTPLPSKYHWTADLDEMDFCLSEIKLLEEVAGPGVTVVADGFKIQMPVSWNVLIYSEETSELDTIKAYELTKGDFTAVSHGPGANRIEPVTLSVEDYHPALTVVVPRISKYQMFCHPVSASRWICISPYEVYNKKIKNAVIGDFL